MALQNTRASEWGLDPVYDEPYAGALSTDLGGFVALGSGWVTQYRINQKGNAWPNVHHNAPTALGDASVV